MSCRLAPVWALALLALGGPSVKAQVPFARDLIPSRTALARVGLERQWLAVVPLNDTERLLRISRSADLFFAQTNHGSLHTYDAQSGKPLWSSSLGRYTPLARPVSSNSYAVFGTSADVLIALDRKTGRLIWKKALGTIPTCGTVCDEDRVMVGTMDGRVDAYSLGEKGPKGVMKIRAQPVQVWGWQTSGPVRTLPLPAEHMVAFGSSDGRVYVVMNDERTSLYRVRTGGAIGEGLADYGTRTLLIPSADYSLYAIDLLTSNSLWTFSSGGVVDQAPLVAGEEIYCINQAGYLTQLDPATGNVRWSILTQGARFVAVGASRIYLRSWDNDLYVIDRASGQVLADPAATKQRAGLNLREFGLSMLNRFDDRLYFGTDSGMVLCLREIGATQPRLLRDPRALPFGYIPPEGIKLTPPPVPAAETLAEPGAE
ncbi:MAG TPA: PQQ-binding-like beta-propeller repeat protein, partial [Candidatus Methylomirabilis sp.]|nr:PQQ-binding-like beta-propeller repeat protein [Candidatus Methylomirabilis sp.]